MFMLIHGITSISEVSREKVVVPLNQEGLKAIIAIFCSSMVVVYLVFLFIQIMHLMGEKSAVD